MDILADDLAIDQMMQCAVSADLGEQAVRRGRIVLGGELLDDGGQIVDQLERTLETVSAHFTDELDGLDLLVGRDGNESQTERLGGRGTIYGSHVNTSVVLRGEPLGRGKTRTGRRSHAAEVGYREGSKLKVDTRADTLSFVAIVLSGRSAEI
ncbi:MAG TPA: hypothetical protein VGG63_02345 [Steroidobacteraceae bacterium]